jgi:hypothetical protein
MLINNSNLIFSKVWGYRNLDTIKYIVIHHIMAKNATVQDIHNWHQRNGWGGIGYHFYIRKNGSIFTGRPINQLGTHVAGNNTRTLGIALEGDFRTERETAEQLEALKDLTIFLKKDLRENIEIVRHDFFGGTTCPEKFDLPNFLRIMNQKELPKANYDQITLRRKEKEEALNDLVLQIKEIQHIIDLKQKDIQYLKSLERFTKEGIIRSPEFWLDLGDKKITREIMTSLVSNILKYKKINIDKDVFDLAFEKNIIASPNYWKAEGEKNHHFVKIFINNLNDSLFGG